MLHQGADLTPIENSSWAPMYTQPAAPNAPVLKAMNTEGLAHTLAMFMAEM